MGKFNKKGKNKTAPKSRKIIRKEKRKEKKQRRFEHYVNRDKPGKFVSISNNNNKNTETQSKKLQPKESPTAIDMQTKQLKAEKAMHKKLQKDMAKQRKKQLKAANLDEDRNIKQLEKQLKLNKRKNSSVPKSFSTDGLDYLLEVCDPENMKGIAAAEQHFTDLNDEFDDDFALVTGKATKETKQSDHSDDEFSDAGSEQSDLDGSETLDEEELDSEQEIMAETSDEEDNMNRNKKRKIESDNKSKKKTKLSEKNSEDSASDEDVSADVSDAESVELKKDEPDTWEDIYGRTRTKDGAVVPQHDFNLFVTQKSVEAGKYIPPALRALKETESVDLKRAEKLSRLRKQLKGLLNRLAESNMHSIAVQVEEMYMANSRNDMNETLTHLIFEALLGPVTTPERLLLEYVLLVTILHANVGTEVGAHFLQTVIKRFDELYNSNQPVENKELDNAVHTIAQLYNFKVFQSQLLYQILAKLSDKFEEKHVECILLVLKNVGFSLRKDDPLALKQLILDLQKKAASVSDNNSRVKYMLDILLAIKNNNVSKIPNYDTSYSEHLKKVQKGFIRKGNYVTQLNISLDDLLKAEERGRWWIVGSAWTGMDEAKQSKENQVASTSYSQKLLDLARKQRMNTDTRRNIFCALMTAENYHDAFEKILGLGLKNQQEREIIHVLLHCSLQEKEYNPYYGLLAQKFCEYDRKYQMIIRCSVWDKLKALTDCSGKQISILARLLTYLFLNQGLPISTLKVIQFSELDQVTLRLIRQVLLGVLLHDDEGTSLAVFEKVAASPKLKMFRESLRLFIHHFLLRNLTTSDLSEDNKHLLSSRAKLAEKSLTSTDSKIKF